MSFQSFTPAAPRDAESRSDAASRSPHPGSLGLRPVEPAEGREPAGVGAVVAIEVRLELVAPSAVEVDDRARR